MSRHQSRSGVATLPALHHEDTRPRDTVVAQLEDRLAQQERTTRSLIDHAFRVKDDVIASLGTTRGSWQAESEARELLQEHIRAITDVVRKLSRDIQFLDAQIKERDGANLGTQQVVKNLELHHVAGVTDLRARVVRCDASIGRLAADLKTAFESIHTVAQKQHEQHSQITEKLHQLENKIQVIASGLERVNSEHLAQLQHVESGTAHQLSGIEIKTKSQVDELKASIHASRSIEQSERERLEVRIMSHIDRTLAAKETKLENLKSKRDEDLTELKRIVSHLDEELSKEKERISNIHRAFQSQSQPENIESRIGRQAEELARLKRDLREGFDAVRQSIEDMKEMVEVRRQLMEEQVHKEILQMRKMIVLV